MQIPGFLLLAVLVVGTALGVVLLRNPIHAVLLLSINLAGVAALYLMLQAQFLALIQVIVYAGPDPLHAQRWLAVPLVGLLLLEVLLILRSNAFQTGPPAPGAPTGVEPLYRLLLTDFLFPFEVTSVLLLAAFVGVMALTKRKAS
jgi:NADH-quinone oxidoreductase subunit J